MRDYLSGIYGNPPQEIAPAAAVHADPFAAVDPSPDLDQIRAEGLAASEEDLLLVALFGDDASRLLATLRGRGDREDAERDGLERSQSERIRELIEMVEGSDVGELTVEDAGVRITVRRQDDRPLAPVAAAPAVADRRAVRQRGRHRRRRSGAVRAGGDEAVQRAQVRARRRDPGGAGRQRRAGRVRPAVVRAGTGLDGSLHELRGAGLVWDTLDATIVLGQDIIQPARRTLPTPNAPHPTPSIRASRETN